MKKCETCEKDHSSKYGSGRFCSEMCARSFSTKIKRAEINEKNSKKMLGRKLSIEHIKKISGKNNGRWINGKNVRINNSNECCDSCGCVAKNKYCYDCAKYSQNKILFKKLNINDVNLKIANDLALRKLKYEYFNKNLSLIEIKAKYKIMLNTIHFFFKKNGVDLRNASESLILSYAEGRSKTHTNIKCKQGWHTTWNNKNVYYHSSYELEYAVFLDSKCVDYDMECLRIKYFDTQKQKVRVAIPDFYISEQNTIVEIKSTYTFNEINMRDKFKKYKELGYNTKLILDHKEIYLQ